MRGVFFGVVMVTLGVLAHASAGGGLPSGAVAALLAVGLVGVATVLTRRHRSLPTLLAVTAACQAALHFGLALADHGMTMSMAGSAAAVPPGQPGHLVMSMTGSMDMSTTMLLSHLVATVLAAVAMAHGERLLAWLCASARWVVLSCPPLPAVVNVGVVGRPQRLPGRELVGRLLARGPPPACASAMAVTPA